MLEYCRFSIYGRRQGDRIAILIVTSIQAVRAKAESHASATAELKCEWFDFSKKPVTWLCQTPVAQRKNRFKKSAQSVTVLRYIR